MTRNANRPSVLVAIADSSAIIRSGLAAVLRRLPELGVQPVEIATPESLTHYLQLHEPDVVIANPAFGGRFDPSALKAAHARPSTRYVALLSAVVDPALLRPFDGQFSICDEPEAIGALIARLLHADAPDDEAAGASQDVLSQREKEIVACVVKGMTNKAIADRLFLSIHTITTHRRNIARKLQIHSTAGLTIYAIVNKLVELEDIKLE